MANGQFDIQARIREVQQRVQSARPNLLPQVQSMLQTRQRAGGRILQNVRSRAQGLASGSPLLPQGVGGGQLLNRVAGGGGPAKFRGMDQGVKAPKNGPVDKSGYRLTT
ncbi:MAG: hypothetical protein ACRDHY_06935 [Anaerolineales bacterium]